MNEMVNGFQADPSPSPLGEGLGWGCPDSTRVLLGAQTHAPPPDPSLKGRTESARGSVSRVLSSPLRTMGDHSSRAAVADSLQQPTRATSRNKAHMPPLFGLAPGGVCRAVSVAGPAVRSYRTLSPLPGRSPRRSAFCGTVPDPACAEPPGVTRHRCSVEPGLSSAHLKVRRGRPTLWRGAI